MPVALVLLLLMLAWGCSAPRRDVPVAATASCALAPERMPETWRPIGHAHARLSQAIWSAAESEDAVKAVRGGLSELSVFFAERPAAVKALGGDAVECFLDASYSASNMPTLQLAARAEARRVLVPLLAPYMERDPASAVCDEFRALLTLTNHAAALLSADGAGTGQISTSKMVALTNAAFHACGSLNAAMGYDYRQKLAGPQISTSDAWDLVMWSISFTDAQLVPGLTLPAEARTLPPALWQFLDQHPLVGAREYAEGAADQTFYDTAYLATHIAYIPTGYGRHSIYMSDSPGLYRFLRENFYPVLELGELDLVAEFVDLFRQYGCTEQTDLQVRDGTRYLLALYHAAGERWIAHREPYETGAISDYDLVHKVWTGMAGVRSRIPEPAARDTYGGIVRAWLGSPR